MNLTDNFKCWYQSRAMWGGLVAFLSGLAALWGYEVTPETQKAALDLITALTTIIGGALALYGRFKATHTIGAPPTEEKTE